MKSSAIFSLFAIALFSFCAFASEEAATADEAVVTLKTDTFDSFVKEHPLVLVEFYAPWCGHCKRLAPEYEAAAKDLKAKDGIPLAKVDATEESELATKYGVSGYPTLKLFRNGKPEDYNGGRTKDKIIEWIASMTGPAVTVVADNAAAIKEIEGADVAFVGAFKAKDNSAHTTFETVASSSRLLGKFVVHFDKEAKDEVSVHRKGEGLTASTPVSDEAKLQKFVKEERFPFFGPINGDNYQSFFESGLDVVWFAGLQKHFDDFGSAIREAAKSYRGKHHFVWLDSEQFAHHAEQSLGVKEFPALVLQTKTGRYVFPTSDFAKSSPIVTFLDDVAAGKIEKNLKSEPIPESDDEAVKTVVGKNFEEMVFHKDKDVMLEVYAPWCGHCKKLEPIYNQFAQSLASNKHVVIAKMDGTANESPVENFDWTGFPTVFFVKAGEKTPISFDGARTLEGLTEFIKKHASKPVDFEEVKDEL